MGHRFVPHGAQVCASWGTALCLKSASVGASRFRPRHSWGTALCLMGHGFVPHGARVCASWGTGLCLMGHGCVPHGAVGVKLNLNTTITIALFNNMAILMLGLAGVLLG